MANIESTHRLQQISRDLLAACAVEAGGPGSGRHPGFGQGKHPGGKPFGVAPGVHKVLTDFGYQHKGASKGLYTNQPVIQYKHPDGTHSVNVGADTGHRWAARTDLGMKKMQHPSMGKTEAMNYKQTNGFGSTSLRDALTKEHGTPNSIKAGGPGSGRKPEGFGSKVHSLAERLKAYEKTWSPKELDKKPFSSQELPDDY